MKRSLGILAICVMAANSIIAQSAQGDEIAPAPIWPRTAFRRYRPRSRGRLTPIRMASDTRSPVGTLLSASCGSKPLLAQGRGYLAWIAPAVFPSPSYQSRSAALTTYIASRRGNTSSITRMQAAMSHFNFTSTILPRAKVSSSRMVNPGVPSPYGQTPVTGSSTAHCPRTTVVWTFLRSTPLIHKAIACCPGGKGIT
jgi:hypothetical protein